MTAEQPPPPKTHRVVIVSAGFGGLECAHRLAGAPVSITLIYRRNHHVCPGQMPRYGRDRATYSELQVAEMDL